MIDSEKKLRSKVWREQNREKLLKQKLDWYYANKDRQRESARKNNRKKWYGLEHEDYLQMLENQNHVCAICGKAETVKNPSGAIKPMSVDHCHTTGKVRGLLCTKCNIALGNFNDDVSILQSAINYLNRNW